MDRSASQPAEELLHVIMAASEMESEVVLFGSEDQADVQSGATFKPVAPQFPNTQAGMSVGLAEALQNGVERGLNPVQVRTPVTAAGAAEP